MSLHAENQRLQWLPMASAIASAAACYGTLLAIAALSFAGISLAVNPHMWAASIVGFAGLAAGGIGYRAVRNRQFGTLAAAVTGTVLVSIAMYAPNLIQSSLGIPSQIGELAGFALLIGAAVWQFRSTRQPD